MVTTTLLWLAGGATFMTRNANGTGVMEEGSLKWSADGRPAGHDQLSRLLLSSARCSFTYDQHAGTSRSTRSQFHPDGREFASCN